MVILRHIQGKEISVYNVVESSDGFRLARILMENDIKKDDICLVGTSYVNYAGRKLLKFMNNTLGIEKHSGLVSLFDVEPDLSEKGSDIKKNVGYCYILEGENIFNKVGSIIDDKNISHGEYRFKKSDNVWLPIGYSIKFESEKETID